MKTFKYVIPERVQHLFLDAAISSVVYNSRTFYKEVWKELNNQIWQEERVHAIIDGFPTEQLSFNDDFVEIIPKDKTFDLILNRLDNDILDLGSNLILKDDNIVGQLIIIESSYRPTMYFKRTDVICAINDNAQEGINNNLRSHLKNKMQDNLFTYKIIDLFNDDLQSVHKFYYYDDMYRYHQSTGAGTLTGWITTEDIQKRLQDKNKVIITLNSNYRLSESFYKRIKD